MKALAILIRNGGQELPDPPANWVVFEPLAPLAKQLENEELMNLLRRSPHLSPAHANAFQLDLQITFDIGSNQDIYLTFLKDTNFRLLYCLCRADVLVVLSPFGVEATAALVWSRVLTVPLTFAVTPDPDHAPAVIKGAATMVVPNIPHQGT